MYPELLLYLEIGSYSDSIIVWCSVNDNIIVDLQKSNNTPYRNVEQECMNLLIKQYNLHETNDFPYQMYYIYS